jgi:maltooligosyltrehalose trehalohydrolase
MSKLDWGSLEKKQHTDFLRFYQKLLGIRQRQIIPRLSGIKGGPAGYRVLSPKALQAWWTMIDQSRLTVIFNMQTNSIDTFALPQNGTLLYHSAPDEQDLFRSGCLPPNSIFWYLSETEKNDV